MKKTLILISACLVNGFLYADFEESVLFFREVYDDSYQEVVGAEVCGCDGESPAVFGVLTIPQTVVYEYEDLFEDENGDWRWCTKSKVLPVVGIDSLSWCPATTIVLPDTIRRIASCAFYCCENLTSVNIPPGVTEIGSGAFWGCRSIVSIELPSTVKCIYDSAFSYCKNLQIVTLKGKLDYLGCWAFYGCFSLQHIRIDGGIVEISYNAFTSCHELQEAPISDITEIIGEYAFSGCSSLKTVTIPDRVKTLEQYVFTDCSGLVSAKVDVGWVSRGTFAGCSNLEEVVFVVVHEHRRLRLYELFAIVADCIPSSIEAYWSGGFLRLQSVNACRTAIEYYIFGIRFLWLQPNISCCKSGVFKTFGGDWA